MKLPRGTRYSPYIVAAYFRECGLPAPNFEYAFAPPRRWRWDISWPDHKVALEVQGGLFSGGGHARGAGILRDMEKFSEAAARGWRILFVEPRELCMGETVELVRRALDGGDQD